MYPRKYFDLYPPLPNRPFVFVAMSFDLQFEPRYRDVLTPAIRAVQRNGVMLEPHRVDSRKISDSILTEILQGIGHDVLILVDITTVGYVGKAAVRPANVMYEMGLAHAVRRPEDVVVFRSDHDPLLFDVANIRVNSYDPDANPAPARELVSQAVQSAIAEIDLTRSLAVEKALTRLDGKAFSLLMEGLPAGHIKLSEGKSMGQLLWQVDRQRAIDRLLDVGAIETTWPKFVSPDDERLMSREVHTLVRYDITELGRELLVRWSKETTGHLTMEQLQEVARRGAAQTAAATQPVASETVPPSADGPTGPPVPQPKEAP